MMKTMIFVHLFCWRNNKGNFCCLDDHHGKILTRNIKWAPILVPRTRFWKSWTLRLHSERRSFSPILFKFCTNSPLCNSSDKFDLFTKRVQKHLPSIWGVFYLKNLVFEAQRSNFWTSLPLSNKMVVIIYTNMLSPFLSF